jgi:hypothetical protein
MRTRQADVLKAASDDAHVKGHGRNFQPLIEAGSWTICGFHYGRSKCACCGRPIYHTLHLKNESHDVSSSFPEQIEVGIVCGPKVFMESCVGFYSDPAREWERQHKAWKDYINYVVLCVKHEALWKLVPEDLRGPIDHFLAEGYKEQEHSGGWWMVKDAKKRFLKCQRVPDMVPEPRVLFAASRGLVYTSKRQGLIPLHWDLKCDWNDGAFTLSKEEPVAVAT